MNPASSVSNEPTGRPAFQIVTGRDFTDWLAAERLSLVLTTYHVGGLIFLGLKPTRELAIWVSAFDRSMGLHATESSLWLATAQMLWRLENSLAPGMVLDGFDRVYVPRVDCVTGDLDVHDVAVDGKGRPVFINTRFNCLATTDERCSFRPLWRPPFVSALVPEDRCHLSGLALVDGQPRYVTMHARSDVADGWRDFRANGGVVLDIASNTVVAEALSMPHSPRWHGGKLWVLNSGIGHFGWIDLKTGKFEPVTFIPGYARGLSFHGRHAFIGLSKPRREHAFRGLPLDDLLKEKGASARCGVHIVDLETGAVVHWLRIESAIEELYDVGVLPGVVRPKALSFATPHIGHTLCCDDEHGQRQHWSSMPAGPR